MESSLAFAATVWGVVMALAPVFQIITLIRNRNSDGVSIMWVLILNIGFVLWGAYGLVTGSIPLIVTNVVSITVGLALLATIIVLRKCTFSGSVNGG